MFPKNYSKLYARYAQSTRLFGVLEYVMKPGLRVLDIGAGLDLRASRWVAKHEAKEIMAVDPCLDFVSIDMTYPNLPEMIPYIQTRQMTLGEYWASLSTPGTHFDLAICQQGVNYWFNAPNAKIVANLLDEGGQFVFDTFNTKPDTVPRFKQYELDGRQYGEAVQLVGDMIYHWQMCEGLKPHFSWFRWIEPKEFDTTLRKFFPVVSRGRQEKTDIYTCHKD